MPSLMRETVEEEVVVAALKPPYPPPSALAKTDPQPQPPAIDLCDLSDESSGGAKPTKEKRGGGRKKKAPTVLRRAAKKKGVDDDDSDAAASAFKSTDAADRVSVSLEGSPDTTATPHTPSPNKRASETKKSPASGMRTLTSFFAVTASSAKKNTTTRNENKSSSSVPLTPLSKKRKAGRDPVPLLVPTPGRASARPRPAAQAFSSGKATSEAKATLSSAAAAATATGKRMKDGRRPNSPSKEEIRAIVLGTLVAKSGGAGGSGLDSVPPSALGTPGVEGDDAARENTAAPGVVPPSASMSMLGIAAPDTDSVDLMSDPDAIPAAAIVSQRNVRSTIEKQEERAMRMVRIADADVAGGGGGDARSDGGAVADAADVDAGDDDDDGKRPGSSGSKSVAVSPSPQREENIDASPPPSAMGGDDAKAVSYSSPSKRGRKKRRAELTLVRKLDGEEGGPLVQNDGGGDGGSDEGGSGGQQVLMMQKYGDGNGGGGAVATAVAESIPSWHGTVDHDHDGGGGGMALRDAAVDAGKRESDKGGEFKERKLSVATRLDFAPSASSAAVRGKDFGEAKFKSSPRKRTGKKGRKGEGKRKDPNAPRRPKSAYLFFAAERRPELKKESPDINFTEMGKRLGADFKSLTAEGRKKYDDMSGEDRARYQREKEGYSPPSDVKTGDTPYGGVSSGTKAEGTLSGATKNAREIKDFAVPSPKTKTGVRAKSPPRTGRDEKIPQVVDRSKLSEELRSVLTKHESLRRKYCEQAEELTSTRQEQLEEEGDLTGECGDPIREGVESGDENPFDGEFPDVLVPRLAALVQGSPKPLSHLSSEALAPLFALNGSLSVDTVASKIKLISERKQYLCNQLTSKTDKFEDIEPSNMWRWELISLDLLPANIVPRVKKARVVRGKLQRHHKSVISLLSALDKADALILDAKSTKDKRDAALAKVSHDEDKVLKFEREEEKNRLEQGSRAQKEKAKAEASAKKEEVKKQADKDRQRQREEKEQKKQEAAKSREEARQKRDDEAQEKKKKEEKEHKAQIERRKKRMMMFFSKSSGASGKSSEGTQQGSSDRDSIGQGGGACNGQIRDYGGINKFDSEAFWNEIGTSDNYATRDPPFANLTSRARESRRRRTPIVPVRVFVTVMPENPFDRQPYDEERIIRVPNRFKFLCFHEDHRPPYHGTWSKPRSDIITGRNPIGKDAEHLNYDVDSEAEWEEGDDAEEGEDCDKDDPNDDEELIDDEEGDTRTYNYQDGWLAQDDDLGLDEDEDDEETRVLRRRKVANAAGPNEPGVDGAVREAGSGRGALTRKSTTYVIASLMGGIPQEVGDHCSTDTVGEGCPVLAQDLVDGISPCEAAELLNSHQAQTLVPELGICLDAFPIEFKYIPAAKKKDTLAADKENLTGKSSLQNSEWTQLEMVAFAKFVHNTTLSSRGKIVEEFRTSHKNESHASRAHMSRKVDLIATKRRMQNRGGVVWEVKKETLEALGLREADLRPAPLESSSPPKRKAEEKSPKKGLKTKKAETVGKKIIQAGAEKREKMPNIQQQGGNCSTNKKKGGRKRSAPTEVSKASATLFAAFLSKKKKVN